jgi:fluoroquinolone resistance protein
MSNKSGDSLTDSLARIANNYQSSKIAPVNTNKSPKKSLSKTAKTTKNQENPAKNNQLTSTYEKEVFHDLNWSNLCKDELVLDNCEFHHCDFSGASLAYVQAKHCTFHECNFKDTSLKEAVFESCSFFDSEKQKGCYFYAAELVNSRFIQCDLSLADLERADVFGIEISSSKAQGCSFKQANFTNVVSRKNLFCSAFLTDSNFRYADFERCQLVSCDLNGSSFINANFFQANLEKCQLINADLTGIQFERLALAGADLRNAQLENLDIRKIDLQGAKINDWQQSVLLESLGIICFPD